MRSCTFLTAGLATLLLNQAPVSGPITIRIADAQGVAGTEARIPIVVERAADLGTIDATFTYDPGLLEFVSLAAGPLNTGLTESSLVRPGVLHLGSVADPPLAGDGELFVVTMKILGAGTAALAFERVKLSAGSTGTEIPAVAQAGTFTAQTAGGTPPPPGPPPPGPPPPGPPPGGPIPRADVPLGIVALLGGFLVGSLILAIAIIVLVRRNSTGR